LIISGKEYVTSIRLKTIDYYYCVDYKYENDVDSSGEYKNYWNAEWIVFNFPYEERITRKDT